MKFNKNHKLPGEHAFLSASKFQWIKYTYEKLVSSYANRLMSAKGTELHDFAAKCVSLHQKLPRSKKTINLYVNDAIGYKMDVEQVLYYSDNCYGTADAICFRDNLLRIHDLKTGVIPAHMEQLWIYAALFCLEYHVDPNKITIELRIYQNDEILIDNPTAEDIKIIMQKIIEADKIIDKLKEEGDLNAIL